MLIHDDTPDPGSLPDVYPANPPVNLLRGHDLLYPRNFFAFEGIDGSGKSTLLRAVAHAMAEQNVEVTTLKLAGSELVRHALERAKWLNVDPVCFSLLNWISIFHQTAAQRDVYNTARLVFFDRYTLTVRVRGQLEGLSSEYMDLLQSMVPCPAATFLIDCPPEVCLERIRANRRPITYFESGVRHVPDTHAAMVEHGEWERMDNATREGARKQTLERTRERYLSLAAERPNVHVIDNSGDIGLARERILQYLPVCSVA